MSYETAGISYFPIGVGYSLMYKPFLEELKVPLNAPFEVGIILENFFQDKPTEYKNVPIIPIIGFRDTCKELERDKVLLEQIIALVYAHRAHFWFFAKELCLRSMQKLHQQYFPAEQLYFHHLSPYDTVYAIGKSPNRKKEVLSVSQISEERIIGCN